VSLLYPLIEAVPIARRDGEGRGVRWSIGGTYAPLGIIAGVTAEESGDLGEFELKGVELLEGIVEVGYGIFPLHTG
jgi:hypothetical protein